MYELTNSPNEVHKTQKSHSKLPSNGRPKLKLLCATLALYMTTFSAYAFLGPVIQFHKLPTALAAAADPYANFSGPVLIHGARYTHLDN